MDITELGVWAQLGFVVLMAAARYLFERLTSRFFKAAKIESTSIQIFAKSIVMVVFNVIVLLLFGLLAVELVAFVSVGQGLIFIAIGLIVAFLVSMVSYFAIKAGYGAGYKALLAKSPTEQVLSWATFLVLVGPAEDLFFLGFVQNLLRERMGWGAIVVYIVLFTLYHYANVLSGVEKKQEFLGALPVRLLVAALLALSFHMTGSLIYGFIIHNSVDTFSYVALMLGARRVEHEEPAA